MLTLSDHPDQLIQLFGEDLWARGRHTKSTIREYTRDLREFWAPLLAEHGATLLSANRDHFVACMAVAQEKGIPATSLDRRVSSARTYYKVLIERGRAYENPAAGIHRPRLRAKEYILLNFEQLETVLNTPNVSRLLQERNQMILRCLAETGMKPSALSEVTTDDLTTLTHPKMRVGDYWKQIECPALGEALDGYIKGARRDLVLDNPTRILFPGHYGRGKMTRQAVWDVVKDAGDAAGVNHLTAMALHRSYRLHHPPVFKKRR